MYTVHNGCITIVHCKQWLYYYCTLYTMVVSLLYTVHNGCITIVSDLCQYHLSHFNTYYVPMDVLLLYTVHKGCITIVHCTQWLYYYYTLYIMVVSLLYTVHNGCITIVSDLCQYHLSQHLLCTNGCITIVHCTQWLYHYCTLYIMVELLLYTVHKGCITIVHCTQWMYYYCTLYTRVVLPGWISYHVLQLHSYSHHSVNIFFKWIKKDLARSRVGKPQ